MSLYISHEMERACAIIDPHLTVQTAATYSGYSNQYLRRLLRNGTLKGVKIGQVWLINLDAIDRYVVLAQIRDDRRCGPRINSASNSGMYR